MAKSQQPNSFWASEPGAFGDTKGQKQTGKQVLNQQRFSPIMNRQHRSATVGEESPHEIPEAVYSPGSPLARNRANRRRSTLHDILERTKKKQEQLEQGAALHSTSSIGQPIPYQHEQQLEVKSPKQRTTDSQSLSVVPAYEANSLPHDTGMVAARAVHKAEFHFRSTTAEQHIQPKSLGVTKSSRTSLMQKRAEQGLKSYTTSKSSRESMVKGSATPRTSMDSVGKLGVSTRKTGPFRVQRSYRITDHNKDSDEEKSDTTPSSSPLSAVFTLPPVQPPPPPKDLPPLPTKLQQQLMQLPRLSPPRKLPIANKPVLQLGLPEQSLPISPGPGSQGSNRRVVSGSSLLRSPSKVSFADAQSAQNMHVTRPGKGQATEVFRRVGYWLYQTPPVQFIKHAIIEERNDSVKVLFPTDRSIWILGVSYRLKKNTKTVMLPATLEADSRHLQMDSSLFLSHHHQRRSNSPTRSQRTRKTEAAPVRRSEDIAGNRRRANTSGAMMSKKKLQGIAQLQNYPGVPPLPEPGTPGLLAKQGLRTLASIPSQDLLQPNQGPTVPISPMPFPDDPVDLEQQSAYEVEPDTDAASLATTSATAPSSRKPSVVLPSRMQQESGRPKSSRINRLRSWVARTAKPIRRKSDVMEAQTKTGSGISSVGAAATTSRTVSPPPPLLPPPQHLQISRLSAESQTPNLKATPRSSNASASGSDPRALGLPGRVKPGAHLHRPSKDVLTGRYKATDWEARSFNEPDAVLQGLPPIPRLGGALAQPPASAGVHGRVPSARHIGMRPISSHSSAASHRRIASNSSGIGFGPNRNESAVRGLISDFAAWESPTASIMMFQREWKLPSFQQMVTVQTATAWAKEGGWTVTLSSETFFMAYIFYNLPADQAALHAPGDKIAGDRLLLRMRLSMEDIDGHILASESWRDTITAIILTIDARVAPTCAAATVPRRNFSQGSELSSNPPDDLSPEDHVKRMKMLEKHLAKVTESFSNHFWPKEDLGQVFNTYPRCRTEEIAAAERRTTRRARGWNMIPTLLTFKSTRPPQQPSDKPPSPVLSDRPESPTLSTHMRKRHLYPMGLSIAHSIDRQDYSMASSHDSVTSNHSPSPSRHASRPESPVLASPSRSPVLSARAVSPTRNRNSVHSQFSAGGRPSSPVFNRGTLGLYSSANPSTLADDFGQSLNISTKPPLVHSTSSQSSGGSSGFINANFSNPTIVSRQHTTTSIGTGCNPHQQRKRKAEEAGVVGKTKGGFEVVWSTTDSLSKSYVMVPVPKPTAPESPSKILKHNHSRIAGLSTTTDADSTGTQSQPNLKRVLESITREINLDSSYVLLLPPPPPIDLEDDEDYGDDEFGYLATTLLRRVKSELVIHRTLQEFEHEYGLDLLDADDGDSDSFQLVNSDDDSSRNSIYFSAEDDAVMEQNTWYRRLSGSSSQYHLPQRSRLQQESESQSLQPHPLSLNQLTLLEFFMDGMRRFYFTYRKGFPTITPSFYTSDMGWGCTYRTCQMLLAESFARVMLGRFWDPFRMNTHESTRHSRIIEWFHDMDTEQAFYSIHRMARTATEMDKRIGDWLGPSIAAHVMRRLSIKHPRCPITIHVAIDQTVYASEVRKQALAYADVDKSVWHPLLLLVPVRLGLSRLNLSYIPKIKTLFQIPQSVGLVGGKPSRSFYFVGRQGDNLFYLDPHVTRQHVPRSATTEVEQGIGSDSDYDSDSSDFEMFGIAEADEYHTTHICSMPINRLDPSMLLGFLFNTEAEWDTFVLAATDKESQRSICTGSSPLFTLMSGSSMMTPQFDSVVQPSPLVQTPKTSVPDVAGNSGRMSPRVNSDSLVQSPRTPYAPSSGLPINTPALTRGRSASSPRFTTADIDSLADDSNDDEFEML
ncbi:hypothetical protein H4S08_000194 [Coemansia sp. RSA 1365]|nr:hypothetical protein H4S08_000194 [Coemansia sp. RSA 1365]